MYANKKEVSIYMVVKAELKTTSCNTFNKPKAVIIITNNNILAEMHITDKASIYFLKFMFYYLILHLLRNIYKCYAKKNMMKSSLYINSYMCISWICILNISRKQD